MMKVKNPIILAAWILFALLTAGVAAAAALTLWASQFPIAYTGLIPVEQMDSYATYLQVTAVQDTLEVNCLLLGGMAYVALLTWHLLGGKPITPKQKWVYTAVSAAALLIPALVMGLCDPVNGLFSFYLFTPTALVAVLVMCAVLEAGLKALQKRKEKKK